MKQNLGKGVRNESKEELNAWTTRVTGHTSAGY
jgi:hypothetical protein